MAETSLGPNPDSIQSMPVPSSGLDNPVAQELLSGQEVAGRLREAQEAWLERRGIDPTGTPRLTMSQREYDLFRNVPSNYLDYVRGLYGLPQDDQDNCQFALVDIVSDDPSRPLQPELMTVNDVDFGTVLEPRVIAVDFQTPSSNPDTPLAPDSAGAYKTVDIESTLVASAQGLNAFATDLMRGETVDPLSGYSGGDVGIRAGGLVEGQQDAYIWRASPLTKSVELTIAFPGQYDSVCIVRGRLQDAANGKVGMAQIANPEVVLKIDGENLIKLQQIYRSLYQEPSFALTEAQRRERDELFNNHLAHLISRQADANRDEEWRQRNRAQRPQLREREIPRA